MDLESIGVSVDKPFYRWGSLVPELTKEVPRTPARLCDGFSK